MLTPIRLESDADPLLTINEVAARMRVHRQSVARYIKVGLLPAVRLPGGHWRVRTSTLEQAMKEARYGG